MKPEMRSPNRKFSTILTVLACLWSITAIANDKPIEIVKSFYKAVEQQDQKSIDALLDPEVTWIFRAQDHLVKYSGTFIGPEGVRDFFEKVQQSVSIEVFEPQNFMSSGSVVTVTGIEQAAVRSTGGRYRIKWVQFYTVENKVITRMEEITDSGALLEAFAPADPARGEAYYTSCAGCHGRDGEGYFAMHAPALTVLDQDYFIRQMRNFRHQVRGGPQDFYGWMMNGRSIALSGDRAIRDVAAFIEGLPDKIEPTRRKVEGSIENGKKIYATLCVSCHAENALGVPSMRGPRLAGLQDWYLEGQLIKFRSGGRGSHPDDVYGAEMKPFAEALEGEQAVQDVAAYIASMSIN